MGNSQLGWVGLGALLVFPIAVIDHYLGERVVGWIFLGASFGLLGFASIVVTSVLWAFLNKRDG